MIDYSKNEIYKFMEIPLTRISSPFRPTDKFSWSLLGETSDGEVVRYNIDDTENSFTVIDTLNFMSWVIALQVKFEGALLVWRTIASSEETPERMEFVRTKITEYCKGLCSGWL